MKYRKYLLRICIGCFFYCFCFSPAVAKKYFQIVGEWVNDENCDDLRDIKPGVVTVPADGIFCYDPDSNTLTMKDVAIEANTTFPLIHNEAIENLRIELIGANKLANNVRYTACIMSEASILIEGSGMLAIRANTIGVYFEKTLTLSGITLDVQGNTCITGKNGTSNEKLIIDRATINTKATTHAIKGCASVTLTHATIVAPTGGKFSVAKHGIIGTDGELAKEVKIAPTSTTVTYPLRIGNIDVTSGNCNELKKTNPNLIEVASDGEFRYYPGSKIMMMKGVRIKSPGKIYTKQDQLRIITSGENNWNGVNLESSAPMSITGDGSLTIRTSTVGLYLKKETIISGITLDVQGGLYGIAGNNGTSGEKLTIDGVRIIAKGSNFAIGDLADLTLKNCKIVKPKDGKFNKEKHGIVDNNGNLAKEVEIVPTAVYSLFIAGKQVTSENCTDLRNINPGVVTVAPDGELSYNPRTKTLKMKGVKIEQEYGICINNLNIAKLKIVVSGENTLKSQTGLSSDVSMSVEGTGTLTIRSYIIGIYFGNTTVDKTEMKISALTIDIQGGRGITGPTNSFNNKLIIDDATIIAKCSHTAIYDLGELTLKGKSTIVEPAGAVFDAKKHGVVDGNGHLASEVEIAPMITYPLLIAGIQVNKRNCADLGKIKPNVVTVPEDGIFNYNPDEKILTMKDVTIVSGNKIAIENTGDEDLKIIVAGTNSLTSKSSALSCQASTSVAGDGVLTLTSTANSDAALFIAPAKNLNVANITLTVEGKYGIAGQNGTSGETLLVRGASINAKGTEYAIGNLTNLTLKDAKIIEPKGSQFNDTEHAVLTESREKAKNVKIVSTTYPLFIAGIQVTEANANKLDKIAPGVVTVTPEGEFKYDPNSKTLTMKEVAIVATNTIAIENKGIADLTIALDGTNTLKSKSKVFCSLESTSTKGKGNLNIENIGNQDAAVYTESTLTVVGITLTVNGKFGITGRNGTSYEEVVTKQATINAKGTEYAIGKLEKLRLENYEIVEPAGGLFNTTKHGVVDSNGNLAKEVKIAPEVYPLVIAGVQITGENCDDLSSIAPGKITVAPKGVFKYDPQLNTLWLKRVTITSDDNIINNEGINELIIHVSGTNTLKSTTSICSFKELTIIQGSGILTLESSSTTAPCVDLNAFLTIAGLDFNIKGTYGIRGNSTTENLTINAATLKITSKEYAIGQLANVSLNLCKIVQPLGADFNASKHGVTDSNGNLVKNLTIQSEIYKIQIAGKTVTEQNYADLRQIATEIVTVPEEGVFQYDPQKKLLTMKDVQIEMPSGTTLVTFTEDLTINLLGKNTLKTGDRYTLALLANTTLQGNGILSVYSGTHGGLYIGPYATVTIAGITLDVQGEYGILGEDGESGESLIIKKATVHAKGTDYAVGVLASFKLEGSEIVEPAGVTWDDTEHILMKGSTIAKEVKIEPKAEPAPDPNAVEDAAFAEIVIAPNPFSSVLRISNIVREGMLYSLINARGVPVLSGVLPEGDVTLSTSDLPSGLYLLRVQTPEGATKSWRMVK